MTYILYNPLAENGNGLKKAKTYESIAGDEKIEYEDMTKVSIYDHIEDLDRDAKVIIAGGDGTINHIINEIGDRRFTRPVLYYGAGTGNDFLRDVAAGPDEKVVEINRYIEDLPVVTVKGETRKFLNGIGYGIDGYCCEEGDRQHAKGVQQVNYAGIAIKGLLGAHKPSDAVVTVDGVTREFKKVWLAPTMKGRFYGGGIKIAPDQDRLDPEKKVTVVIAHDLSRIGTLMIFSDAKKGDHVKKTDKVSVFTGYEVNIKFTNPTALQVDGDTFTGVTEYSVSAK